jgi:hypothetical protein
MLNLTVLAHENGSLELKWALAWTFVEITNLYFDGVLQLQHEALGSVLYLPAMVAKK